LSKIRLAIAGVGNCASALIQGLEYYRNHDGRELAGLMRPLIGRWDATDVEVVAAFDIDRRKVGLPVERAIFAKPNCTTVFQNILPVSDVVVQMGPVMDGVPAHMADYPDHQAFRVADVEPVDIVEALRAARAEVLVCYLPVGSELAVRHYAEACLADGVAMVNCVPVFIASDPEWAARFREAGVPIVGDDIKSQVGATIVHRTLSRLFNDRGVEIERTYQLNTGGNTDFLNMLEMTRLASKKRSKTESVQSQLETRLADDNIHIGPSDYVPWQHDNKVAFIRLEGRGFGDVPMNLELRLSVEDSPNSAGVVIDAIRCAKLGMERGLSGPLEAASAYFMKSPPVQVRDSVARDACTSFINNGTPDLPDAAGLRPARARVVGAETGRTAASAVGVRSALILAAGPGRRLFPHGSLPKPLTPVNGLTLAERVIRTLRHAANVNHFVVSLGYEAETVRSHFQSLAMRNNVRVEFVSAPNYEAGNGASALAGAEILDDEPFLLSMCDHLYDHGLVQKLIETAPSAKGMRVAVDLDKGSIPDDDSLTKVSVAGERIAAIRKGLTSWDGAETGVMYSSPALFDGLREAGRTGFYELSGGIAKLAEEGLVQAVDVTGSWWLDVDTCSDIRDAEDYLAKRERLSA